MNRREEIILASTKVIGNEGIKSFTIKKLAMNLPLTEGAIYRHFKSKEEILLAPNNKFFLKNIIIPNNNNNIKIIILFIFKIIL